MVFAQTALARDCQQALSRANPGMVPSYGGLEGFMTARALLLAFRAAGPTPSRDSLLAGAASLATVDLGGLPLRWRKGEHAGCTFVDLALVSREGRFVQ